MQGCSLPDPPCTVHEDWGDGRVVVLFQAICHGTREVLEEIHLQGGRSDREQGEAGGRRREEEGAAEAAVRMGGKVPERSSRNYLRSFSALKSSNIPFVAIPEI